MSARAYVCGRESLRARGPFRSSNGKKVEVEQGKEKAPTSEKKKERTESTVCLASSLFSKKSERAGQRALASAVHLPTMATSSPREGDGDGDLTLRPHAPPASSSGGLAPAGPAKPFFGAALALDLANVTTPTTMNDATAAPSPLLRAALKSSSSQGGGSGAMPPLASYLTPQTAALAAELAALAVMGTGDAPSAPLEVAAARDGAPPEGAPLHLVVKKVRAATPN